MFTGDDRQLLNYVQDVPEIVRPYGSESMLTYLHKLSDSRIRRVVLTKTYRFHPAIAACLAATGYGDKLVCVVPAAERAMVTSAPLWFPQPDFPILLLHQEDEDVREDDHTSRHNAGQAEKAFEILIELLVRLPAEANVVMLCLYTAEKDRMIAEMRRRNLTRVLVRSVDGFQASEADVVYVLTTRSVDAAEGDRSLEFIEDDKRATTALSRGRHVVIVHGNLRRRCVEIIHSQGSERL